MEQSPLRLIKRKQEHLPKSEINSLPTGLRGIYVLYRYRRSTGAYNVVYVGMARSGGRGGIRGRLKSHRRHKTTREGTQSVLWTHCSVYEVWENIRDEEVIEMEGLFRQIYALDQRANSLNKQTSFGMLKRVEDIIED